MNVSFRLWLENTSLRNRSPSNDGHVCFARAANAILQEQNTNLMQVLDYQVSPVHVSLFHRRFKTVGGLSLFFAVRDQVGATVVPMPLQPANLLAVVLREDRLAPHVHQWLHHYPPGDQQIAMEGSDLRN